MFKRLWRGGVAKVLLLFSFFFVISGQPATVSVFDGKGLSGWRAQGGADWRVADGQLTGTAKSAGGGWLVLDKSYEDLVLRLTFRCEGDCGVMLRRQSSESGGASGVYVPFTGEAAGNFLQVALDGQGNETGRKLLLADRPRPRLMSPMSIIAASDGWTRAQIKLHGPVAAPPEDIKLMTGWGSYRNLPFPPRVRVNFGEVALRVSTGELRVKEISI